MLESKQYTPDGAETFSFSSKPRLTVPTAELASPENYREGKILGQIDVPTFGRYEFFIPSNSVEPGALDLVVRDTDGREIPVVQALLNYDDSLGDYNVVLRPNQPALDLFRQHGNIDRIIETYLIEEKSGQRIYVEKRRERSNNHIVRTRQITQNNQTRSYEFIHQQQSGDCVLATTLNTVSFNKNGHMPSTIQDMRKLAIFLRQEKGEDGSDIQNPDSPLSYADFIDLLCELTERPARQENVMTISGESRDGDRIGAEILDMLDKLASSDYRTMAIGTGYHARTLKDLGGGEYGLIDPMLEEGVKRMTTQEVVTFLTAQCFGRREDQNFFYIV